MYSLSPLARDADQIMKGKVWKEWAEETLLTGDRSEWRCREQSKGWTVDSSVGADVVDLLSSDGISHQAFH